MTRDELDTLKAQLDTRAVEPRLVRLLLAERDALRAACESLPLGCDFEDSADYKDNARHFDRAMDLARTALGIEEEGDE